MSLSSKIRDQIISSFRAELAEHLQTMNDGLLALEQQKVAGSERAELLGNVFRAAHSLKGAARAVGVSVIEQLAHALEDVLGALQTRKLMPSAPMFNACYQALDAIQSVQTAYEGGESTPPTSALTSLVALEPFRHPEKGVESPPDPAKIENGNQKLAEILSEAARDLAPEQAHKESQARSAIVSQAESQVEPAPAAAPVVDETIRVNVSKVDALMERLSELLTAKIHAGQRLNQVREAQAHMSEWQKEWFKVRGVYTRLARHGLGETLADEQRRKEVEHLLNYLEISQERMRQMLAMTDMLAREYNNDSMQLSIAIDGMDDEIKRVRMLPFNTIAGTFTRMVRDIAQASGKDAMLQIIGGEVELDKRVLEQIKDPVMHVLRNAIDHGIETPEIRATRGKPPYGTITLAIEQIGKEVSISVADDGAGLNIEAIRTTAVKRGIANAVTLDEAELAELIYGSGFSTSTIITDVSGRGVGLDVVRRNVETLHGLISVDWKAGQGSRFTLLLPLALTTSRALTVYASGQPFAIPLNSIRRIFYVSPDDISQVGGIETLKFDNRPLTLVALDHVLGLPHIKSPDEGGRVPVVVLSLAERTMAFAVDALGKEQEVVMKGLGRQLSRVAGLAGASVTGSGEALLILNVADLMKLAISQKHRPVIAKPDVDLIPEAIRTRRRILIVDDSITTRTLEKNILEAAGYIVQLANDGQEALNALATGSLPDLVISDIQMPRVNGFMLTAAIKKDQRTGVLPVILVTSLDSQEDKVRGIEAGADAYIFKSAFDQNGLLETIQQLIQPNFAGDYYEYIILKNPSQNHPGC